MWKRAAVERCRVFKIDVKMMKAMDIPFDIVPFSDCSLSDIRIKAEALKKRSGVDQIIIDHAKMISLPGKAGDLFAERINGLYRGLKGIAKMLNIHIVILIQRNDEWRRGCAPVVPCGRCSAMPMAAVPSSRIWTSGFRFTGRNLCSKS